MSIRTNGLSIGRRTGVRLAGGGGLTYLLRDDFLTDAAAPLASPRTAEPGPGTLTLVQTDGQFSIANGKLSIPAQSTPVWGDLSFYAAGLSRVTGRTLLSKINKAAASNAGPVIRWAMEASGAETATAGWGLYFNGPNILMINASTASFIVGLYSAGVDYDIAIILRSTGSFAFVKNGAFTSWTLLWVDVVDSTATIYPGMANYNAASTLDTFRVLDLPAPFDADFGLATQRLAGARSAGDTLTHTANCLLEFVCTTRPSADQIEVRLRAQDTSNYWQVTVDSSGNLDLDEVVAGVVTQRGTAAGVIANGDRIVVVADGSTIRVYEANTLRITYTSASNFATATSGKLETLGAGGAVSDLVAWPRTLTGTPASLLDQAVA